jgi:hypothetical protein
MMRIHLLLLISLFVVLQGCASFSKNQVARVDKMPDVSKYKNKPSAYIDVRFFSGDPDKGKAAEYTMARDKVRPMVEKEVSASNLFSSFTFDEFKKNETDYTIKLHFYNHGDAGGAAIGGFLCGFTFGVIPAAATDNYTLKYQLVDKGGKVVKDRRSKDAMTTWMGIWFIPAAGNTPEKAFEKTLTNQVRDALKNLVEDGSLQYSSSDELLPDCFPAWG